MSVRRPIPTPLLSVDDLHMHLPMRGGTARVLNGVSFSVRRREILGLVGETGSGKSMTASSILRLIPPPGRVVRGTIVFDGEDLLSLSEEEMRRHRGGDISLIPQNARGALNPLLPVGRQMLNVYSVHMREPNPKLKGHALTMLRAVGLANPDDTFHRYPHELSGGMAQRIAIAIALGTSPQLVIADEPTTGLDATVQVQVLDLLVKNLVDSGTSALLITHDLGLVANYCDRAAVMHAGRIVESATVSDFFTRPSHPYSAGLLNAQRTTQAGPIRIDGSAPNPAQLPSGCFFRERCPLTTHLCVTTRPEPRDIGSGHRVECHHAEQLLELEDAAAAH